MHTAKKKIKREKDLGTVINHSRHQHSIYRLDITRTTKEISPIATPSKREQRTSVVIALPEILGFHHRECLSCQTNAFNKSIARYNQKKPDLGFHLKINTRYLRSTTKNEILQCSLPHLLKPLLQLIKHQPHMYHA